MMESIISGTQNAFLKGRNILDGVVALNEILDHAKKGGKPCVLIKVDFEKAYDLVSWEFLDYMMLMMGFNAK